MKARVTEAECVRIAAKECIQEVPGRANLGRHENLAGDTRGSNMVRVRDKQVRARSTHGKSSKESSNYGYIKRFCYD